MVSCVYVFPIPHKFAVLAAARTEIGSPFGDLRCLQTVFPSPQLSPVDFNIFELWRDFTPTLNQVLNEENCWNKSTYRLRDQCLNQ